MQSVLSKRQMIKGYSSEWGTVELEGRRGKAYAPLEYSHKDLLRAPDISELLEISARALDSLAQTPRNRREHRKLSMLSVRVSRVLAKVPQSFQSS